MTIAGQARGGTEGQLEQTKSAAEAYSPCMSQQKSSIMCVVVHYCQPAMIATRRMHNRSICGEQIQCCKIKPPKPCHVVVRKHLATDTVVDR